jgi:hypothetical protein
MSKNLDWKYYETEVNDKNEETKCTQIIIWKISNPSKKTFAWIFETNIENTLKLKGITTFNMNMIINYFLPK